MKKKEPFFRSLTAIFLVMMSWGFFFGQEPLKPYKTNIPPDIDGVLNDPVWEQAPYVTGFKTFYPDFGLALPEKTHAYAAYDTENLYFAFRCFDSQPDKIKAAMAKRDDMRADDWVCINLDSFNDQQSLYALYINPLGIQGDSIYAGGEEDHSADIVWYSAGRIDEEGYAIEVKLPLKSIRYSGREKVEMAVIFERRISRTSEQGTYPPMDPKQGYFFLTQMMPLLYYGIKPYTLLEVLPAFSYNKKYAHEEGQWLAEKAAKDLSLTTKVGLSPKLILDATYNPDFSQIESDAGQVDVNLRYDLFYLEKRPFFLEGHEHFNFAAASDFLLKVVHTRTIVDPRFGLKLTGKVGRKNTIASIFAADESPSYEETASETGKYAWFGVFRFKRAISRDGYLGMFYTGRDLKDRFNRVVGSDGQVRLNKSSMLSYHMFYSATKAEKDAGINEGTALAVDYLYDTRKLGMNFTLMNISPDFETQTGYQTRTGIRRAEAYIQVKFYPHKSFIRTVFPSFFTAHTLDIFDELYETNNQLSLTFLMGKNTSLLTAYHYSTEVFAGRSFDTSGVVFLLSSRPYKWFSVSASLNKNKAIYYSSSPYQGRSLSASGSLNFQPSENLADSLSLAYADFFRTSDGEKIYDYSLIRNKLTYQVNKYLFFRGIVEYNTYRKKILADFLASFTYIPGTVVQLGYGSIFERISWVEGEYRESQNFLETRRGLFFKVSYLWRL
ncbi:MAG: carbohydrate binding family 9 domain-containing protein [Candidatus Aminicenantes bacterium]|nr:carbohydrate binding family 9 domain-containing protein [Candidatus Aminicenantes bacterium]